MPISMAEQIKITAITVVEMSNKLDALVAKIEALQVPDLKEVNDKLDVIKDQIVGN